MTNLCVAEVINNKFNRQIYNNLTFGTGTRKDIEDFAGIILGEGLENPAIRYINFEPDLQFGLITLQAWPSLPPIKERYWLEDTDNLIFNSSTNHSADLKYTIGRLKAIQAAIRTGLAKPYV